MNVAVLLSLGVKTAVSALMQDSLLMLKLNATAKQLELSDQNLLGQLSSMNTSLYTEASPFRLLESGQLIKSPPYLTTGSE